MTDKKKPPVILLTKKQTADLHTLLKGMTLAGVVALATKDEERFQVVYERQQAIITALDVLGISVETINYEQ